MKEEEILLSLLRQFSKDDAVRLLQQQLSSERINIGFLRSECHRLEYEYELLGDKLKEKDKECKALVASNETLKRQNKELRKPLKESEPFKIMNKENLALKEQVKGLRSHIAALVAKLCQK